MKLKNLIPFINENTMVQIYNGSDDKPITEYDGKNSIDEIYLQCYIDDISVENDILKINVFY